MRLHLARALGLWGVKRRVTGVCERGSGEAIRVRSLLGFAADDIDLITDAALKMLDD
jgi:hypothetical protein